MGVACPQYQDFAGTMRVIDVAAHRWRAGLIATCIACTLTPFAAQITGATELFRPTIAVTPEGLTCVLGGGLDGEMVDAMTITPLMTHKQEYTLLTVKGVSDLVLSIGRPAEESKEDDGCAGTFQQELSLGADNLGKYQVAVLGKGEDLKQTLPKKIEILTPTDTAYQKIVSDYLKKGGLNDPQITIRQLVKTDLDSDGVDEVLLNASRTERDLARKGEYSVVLVHKTSGASAKLYEVLSDITVEDSDDPSDVWENTIAGIVDIDGDGIMEIVIYSSFYFGDAWQVLRLKDGAVDQPLVCGCGG